MLQFIYDSELKSFSEGSKSKSMQRIGTASLSFPIPNKRRIDKRGRRRRLAMKVEVPLLAGPGTLNSKGARTQVSKDLADTKALPLKPQVYRKFVQAFKPKV